MTQMTHFREEKFLRLTFQFWDFIVNFLRPTAEVSGRFTANGCPH